MQSVHNPSIEDIQRTEVHRLCHPVGAELDHDRVGITVNDIGVMFVAVGDAKLLFDFLHASESADKKRHQISVRGRS